MYTTCMFCRKPLGANEVVETFPVGRRLAFDAARGRLWVVCRKCERWNLTPLEERWEAVEDCERIFRDARLRVSTGNIGLAKHPEGLTLVRIGEPPRPEFAAWRYGDQFGRRRRRMALSVAAGLGVAAVAGGPVGVGSALLMLVVGTPRQQWRKVVEIPRERRSPIAVRGMTVEHTRIRLSEDGARLRLQVVNGGLWADSVWLEGEEARRVAAILLPVANRAGGRKRTVSDAVDLIETAGGPEPLVTDLASSDDFHWHGGTPGYLAKMPAPTRLALEMALHEETERRALEGELRLLERAWREAEEIAAIADNLLLPDGAEDFVREHGRTRDPGKDADE